MTYNVFSGTLNLTQLQLQLVLICSVIRSRCILQTGVIQACSTVCGIVLNIVRYCLTEMQQLVEWSLC